jgi:pimeloyl-ACP methyl ester carboxylesterase
MIDLTSVRIKSAALGVVAVAGASFLGACSAGGSGTAEESDQDTTNCVVSRQDGSSVESGSLEVPGAGLYYEIRGTGPLLLLIHGGASDAQAFDWIAPALAEDYTVLAYDRRGNSRSELAGDPEDLDVTEQADDARRLLEEFCSKPAYVFGSSGGGTVALELATRFPDQVDTVITHEPTVFRLAPDADAVLAGYQAVYDTYLDEGPLIAMREFLRVGNPDADSREIAGWEPADEQQSENVEFLLAHEMLPFVTYQVDIDALRSSAVTVLPAAGSETGTNSVYLATEALAEGLGVETTLFPGDHTGYVSPEAAAFADRLREVLR